MQGREEGAFTRDASNPESTAHDHVDPHGLLGTKNVQVEEVGGPVEWSSKKV